MASNQRPGTLLAAFFDYIVELIMLFAPQDTLSMQLKRQLLHWRGCRVGKGTKIWRDVWIDSYRSLQMGDHVTIGKSVMILSVGGIVIDDRVMIGHGAKIISGGHKIPDSRELPMRWSGPELGRITIDQDAWIGAGAIILPAVHIGRGAVVAAGAVVSRSVPPYSVVAGVPARHVRMRP
jgi:acetyltransferase-like isoleucine patch superfamily enzyme